MIHAAETGVTVSQLGVDEVLLVRRSNDNNASHVIRCISHIRQLCDSPEVRAISYTLQVAELGSALCVRAIHGSPRDASSRGGTWLSPENKQRTLHFFSTVCQDFQIVCNVVVTCNGAVTRRKSRQHAQHPYYIILHYIRSREHANCRIYTTGTSRM